MQLQPVAHPHKFIVENTRKLYFPLNSPTENILQSSENSLNKEKSFIFQTLSQRNNNIVSLYGCRYLNFAPCAMHM